ncbi:hypothetical protein PRIPAC_95764 [Pristionchus pacificus]|uniref:Uncharacterized protein n=1 Tax=Pristionchus pacificus TaxID=54126 RepID=A0A2A6BCB4_PRIPA|nr:hypothetical protein PRIPAC_95764 [Pristionchus pacificus]|eukprot:PDM63481.1 hypothetical protein PRIPAC_53838 [Pristionchus pacificus]
MVETRRMKGVPAIQEKRKIDSLIKRDKKRDEQNDKLLADSFGRIRTQKISLQSMKVKYPGKCNWKKKGEVDDKEEGAPKDPKSPKRFRSLGQIERESDRLENEEAGVLKDEVVLSLGEEWHGRMKDFHDLISLFVKQDEKAGYASVLAPYLPKIKEDVKKLEVSKRKKKKVAMVKVAKTDNAKQREIRRQEWEKNKILKDEAELAKMELTLLEKENRRNTLKAQLGLVKPFHQSLMRGAVPVLRSRYRSMLDDLQKALNEIDAEVAVLEKMNEEMRLILVSRRMNLNEAVNPSE